MIVATRCICAYILLSLSFGNLWAQEDDSAGANSADTVWLVKSFVQDEGRLWTAPFRMRASHLLFWVPVLSATCLSIAHDEDIYNAFKSFQADYKWVDSASPWVTFGGDGTLDMGICTGFYLGGLLSKNNRAMETGLLAAQALAHAGLIVTVGKELSSRKRPHGANDWENGMDKWHWFPNGLKEFTQGAQRREYDSFPSGHSISIWSVATVIAGEYHERKWVGAFCYTLATGVSLSRVTEDAHWFSDVILGSALGYAIGRNMLHKRKNTRWLLFPQTWHRKVVLTGIYAI